MKSKKISVKFDGNIRAFCVTFFALVVVGVSGCFSDPGRSPNTVGEARKWKAQLLHLARAWRPPASQWVVVCFQHSLGLQGISRCGKLGVAFFFFFNDILFTDVLYYSGNEYRTRRKTDLPCFPEPL